MEMIIKHFSHEHELLLSKKDSADTYHRCFVCDGNLYKGVMIYSCRDYRFSLHESCAKVPQKLHNPLLHPHPLSLHPRYGMYGKCNACGETIWGFTFRCEKDCNVNFHVKCTFIRPAAIEEGEEEAEAVVVGTRHFSDHEHPWLLLEKLPTYCIRCRVCGGWCSDPKTYGCLPCGFFLHPSCLNLPEEIVHPFHPYHPLTLKPIKDPLTLKSIKDDHVKCNACRKDIYGHANVGCFAYFSEEFDFNLDVECAFIRPVAIEEGEEEAEAVVVGTHHFSHPKHPLLPFENMPAGRIYCNVCRKYCSDLKSYGCLPCGFFLHPSCFKLPEEIVHPFHPYHRPLTLKPIMDPLTLKPIKDNHFKCNACRKYIYGYVNFGGFAYFCEECDFNFDVACAFIRPAAIEEGEEEAKAVVGTHHFTHHMHEHPLQLLQNIPAHCIRCQVCQIYCSNPKSYGCLPCGFFLHPSCFKLLQEMFHPFHPYHPLTLKPIKDPLTLKCIKDDHVKCNACRKDIYGDLYLGCFAYFCEHCNNTKTSFCLHTKCASVIMPTITFEGHDHLLQFDDNIREIYCSACYKSSTCESYGGFRCLQVDCDFNLHLSCGPLPYTIQHQSHIHPLILTTSPLEDEENCEPDEYYCDACEEQRVDPFLSSIYYCKECHFVAEVKCVISEVVSSLNGEYGDVELRNPLGQFGKVITKDTAKEMIQKKDKKQLEPTLTWGNVLSTLSEDEEKEKNLLTDRIEVTITAEKIEAYDHEEIIMFSDKAYTQFMKFLNHSGFSNDKYFRYPWDLSNYEDKEAIVNVGDYMTTRRLSPILNHLLSNHGDIGAQSTLSPKFKSLYVCMLCKCIYHMRNTMVVDVTHDILLDWWTCLKILQLERFQIDFAFDRLKRVTHAHFGLYAEKQVDSALHQLDRDIEKLEALKSKRERIKSAKSTKSKIIEECLRDAFVLGKGKADMSRLL